MMSITRDALIGFAIGDAMGVPVEFQKRDILLEHPVTKMYGHGSYDVPEGTWSDDTSMTLATMDSLIRMNGELNYNDIADRFINWVLNAEYTATNEVFDIGNTTRKAIVKYSNDRKDATLCGSKEENENGNGSLMRMLPIALYCHYKKVEYDEIYTIVKKASSITHAHPISILGCYIYVRYLLFILSGKDKFAAYSMVRSIDYEELFSEDTISFYNRLLNDDIKKYKINDIKSSGFVRDSIEAAIWVILKSTNFQEAIIGSVNLGGDTDTIGAITGSIAGVLYGLDTFPEQWLNKLKKRETLEDIAKGFEDALGVNQE